MFNQLFRLRSQITNHNHNKCHQSYQSSLLFDFNGLTSSLRNLKGHLLICNFSTLIINICIRYTCIPITFSGINNRDDKKYVIEIQEAVVAGNLRIVELAFISISINLRLHHFTYFLLECPSEGVSTTCFISKVRYSIFSCMC